jgi:hypothetical protein
LFKKTGFRPARSLTKKMQSVNIIFGVATISCGILFILISIPLAAKKVPMNKLYGFRIQKSLASDENWYEINQYGGRQLIFWSVPLICIGILYFMFPVPEGQSEIGTVFLAAAPIAVCLTAAVLKTLIYSKRF